MEFFFCEIFLFYQVYQQPQGNLKFCVYKNNSDIWEDFTGDINIDLSNEKILDTKFLKCNE